MVSESLLWPFLCNLVFIGVTPFSILLLPSQQSPQPFAVEPLTSSSHCLWVPDLQPLSLRSPTPHKPLHMSSPPWILLRLRFYKYHGDHLALIYTLVEASQPSETAHGLTRHMRCHQLQADITCVVINATSALAYVGIQSSTNVNATSSPLTIDRVDFDLAIDFDRWLFFRVNFYNPSSPCLVFRIDFIFAICFCILCL